MRCRHTGKWADPQQLLLFLSCIDLHRINTVMAFINDCWGNSTAATTLQWSLVSDQWQSKQTDIKVNLPRCLLHNNTIINHEGRAEFYSVTVGWATRTRSFHTNTEANTGTGHALISPWYLGHNYVLTLQGCPHSDRQTSEEVSLCLCICGVCTVIWLTVLLFVVVSCPLVSPWPQFSKWKNLGLKITLIKYSSRLTSTFILFRIRIRIRNTFIAK